MSWTRQPIWNPNGCLRKSIPSLYEMSVKEPVQFTGAKSGGTQGESGAASATSKADSFSHLGVSLCTQQTLRVFSHAV